MNLTPVRSALVACSVAESYFEAGDWRSGMVAYERATHHLESVGHPLDWLVTFIKIEALNRRFVQYLGE